MREMPSSGGYYGVGKMPGVPGGQLPVGPPYNTSPVPGMPSQVILDF